MDIKLLLAAISPAFIILYIFYQHDHAHNKEPLSLLVKCFFAGVLSTLVSFLFSYPLGLAGINKGVEGAFYEAFFIAAIPEELAKLIMLHLVISRSHAFDHYYDGILYAVCVSMGFAGLENILYVSQGGYSLAITRAIFSVPGHMLFAVPMGFFYSYAKFQPSKKYYFLGLCLLMPIILHGTFDFGLMATGVLSKNEDVTALLILVALLIFIIWMWRYGLKKIAHTKKINIEE
jgi:RsiW-degrading membrane proteinase PrsW (M82 family)